MDFDLDEFLDLDIVLDNALEDSPDWPDFDLELPQSYMVNPPPSWNDSTTPFSLSSSAHKNLTDLRDLSSIIPKHDEKETHVPPAEGQSNEEGRDVSDTGCLPNIPPGKFHRLEVHSIAEWLLNKSPSRSRHVVRTHTCC